MSPGPDPLSPASSRFPLSPPGGRVEQSAEHPSGPWTRPFGMGFAVAPFAHEGRHGKKPTHETKREQTAIYNDGQISGYKEDVEITTYDDEE